MGASSTVQSTVKFFENNVAPVLPTTQVAAGIYHIGKGAKEKLIDEPAKMREEAKKRGDEEIARQTKIMDDQKIAQEKTKKQTDVRKRRIDSKTMYAGQRSSMAGGSIRTSPLGIVDQSTGAGGKTLIGS